MHGNNKSEVGSRAAAEAVRLVVLDAPGRGRARRRRGRRRVLVRATPGIEAETHEAIRTGHHGSKFGLTPSRRRALRRARAPGLDALGLHVHLGSQLLDVRGGPSTIDWLAGFAARVRRRLDWVPGVDVGGGLGIRYPRTSRRRRRGFVGTISAPARRLGCRAAAAADPRAGPVARRGRRGDALPRRRRQAARRRRRSSRSTAACRQPAPPALRRALRGALANRADEPGAGDYAVGGKHCESGDVLIQRVSPAGPRRGDLLAVPATGAYTLAMGSNYNAVPRPAAVLVADGRIATISERSGPAELGGSESG